MAKSYKTAWQLSQAQMQDLLAEYLQLSKAYRNAINSNSQLEQQLTKAISDNTKLVAAMAKTGAQPNAKKA